MPVRVLLFFILLALLKGDSLAQTPAAKARFVHEPDLRLILTKFLNAQGFLDQEFADATAKPYPYLTDFYGIQALANTTKERIKRDFVPKYAEIVNEDEHTIELKFKSGYTGKFFVNATLKVVGQTLEFDHVSISGATWREQLKNLEDLRGLIVANKWDKRYLVPNEFYREEQVVAKQLSGRSGPATLNVITEPGALPASGLVSYPEGVHGDEAGYKKFKENVLDKIQFDWVALEMLAPVHQKDLDAFVRSAEGTVEYDRARKALLDYFKDAWNGRRGPKVPAEENYYFKIVDQMRARKTRVIGVEASTLPYLIFRYGENKFGGAVRSLLWARYLPKSGRGLIFGGSGHFNDPTPINFQDFQAKLNPKMKQFVIEPIKVRRAAQ